MSHNFHPQGAFYFVVPNKSASPGLRIIEHTKRAISAPPGLRDKTVFDRQSDYYLILREGWDGSRRIHGPVVSLEIIDGKVWLQADNTDLRIAERLEEAGIPKGDFSEIEAEEVWRRPFPGLAPFVPVLRGGAEIPMVRRALETIRAHERLQEMESLLAFMASLVMDKEVVKQIVRWDMSVDVIEQNWLWQEITQRENAKLLLLMLEQQLGPLDQVTRERIRNLPPAQLEAMAKALFSFKTSDDLKAWLGAIDLAATEQQSNGSTD